MSNEWCDRYELPPVGTECEYFWHESPLTWAKGIIVSSGKHGEKDCVCIKVGDQLRIGSSHAHFRPIKSEREKAIEEILKILNSVNVSNEKIAELLYEAGHKVENKNDN